MSLLGGRGQAETARAYAAHALGVLRVPEALPLLVDSLRCGGALLRCCAARALGEAGTPAELGLLLSCAAADADAAVRNAACVAAHRVCRRASVVPDRSCLSGSGEERAGAMAGAVALSERFV
ncbi:MAG: HEAT repeat domain-containing protein [Candidatus Latescibacterota bacterium]